MIIVDHSAREDMTLAFDRTNSFPCILASVRSRPECYDKRVHAAL